MRAVHIVSHDGPGSVRLVDVADPVPGRDEVLVRVRAAGVSFPELLQTRGSLPALARAPVRAGFRGVGRGRLRAARVGAAAG